MNGFDVSTVGARFDALYLPPTPPTGPPFPKGPTHPTAAGPHDPGVEDLPRRLLRAISTRIQHRAAIAAARAADPPGGISATTGSGGVMGKEAPQWTDS